MPVFLSFGHMDANVCVIIIDINRLTYGRTSVYNLNYHLIWGTKYRNKVLKGHVETVLKRTLYEIASKYGFTIDHIHLLVSAPPGLSVTNIMRWLKEISAWQLFRECPELQTSYRKKQDCHLWSPNYYVESIGTVNEQAVARYIDKQRRKEVNLE